MHLPGSAVLYQLYEQPNAKKAASKVWSSSSDKVISDQIAALKARLLKEPERQTQETAWVCLGLPGSEAYPEQVRGTR